MPKIKVSEAQPAPSDKAEWARECAIQDLMIVENNKKMYINQKKQLQSLIYKLYELGYYENINSIFLEVNV